MRVTVATAVACLFVGVSIADDARAAIRRPTNIPAQNLGEALQTLARDCDVQVVYFSTSIDALSTNGAAGTLTTDEAFEKVLSGTGYTFRYLAEKTITIVPVAAQEPGGGSAPQKRNEPGDPGKPIDLEEVVVTGSHIRGAQNPTVPLTVLNREYIDSTGLTTTTRLVESLPQNFALSNQSTSSGSGLNSGTSLTSTQGSSINLRGMGEGTTLVLVNGRRMAAGYEGSAVDISALPLSAVERVEVVTDGASAIYGSDAVGGVVNFVLRSDYEGAETRVRAGFADGIDEYRASQTLGTEWGSGNVVLFGEYYYRDLLLSTSRDYGTDSGVSTIGSLLPRDNNHSLLLSGKQRLSESLELFSDVLYTNRDTYNIGTRITTASFRSFGSQDAQLSSALGLDWDMGNEWRLQTHFSHGSDKLDFAYYDPLATSRSGNGDIDFNIDALEVKADGPLFTLPGGAVRAALGANRRMEELSSHSVGFGPTGALTTRFASDRDRDVNSVFGEVLIPLIGENNAVSLARRVELSLAARYDDYTDFGSSTDPRYGIAWEPLQGLRLRGSWGTSYLAPKLSLYNIGFNGAAATFRPDPGLGRTSYSLIVQGNAPDSLVAQESENYTIGIEWTPASLDAKFAIGYYDIDYRNRITVPPDDTVVLGDPAAYGDLIIRNPTVAQVNQYISYGLAGQGFFARDRNNRPVLNFDPAAVEVIVDLRKRNMSAVRSNGIDLSAQYGLEAFGGKLNLALDGTYILELVYRVTETSSSVDQVDTFMNPTHLRLRGQVGYRRGGWSSHVFVNHRNAYDDNRLTPVVSIDSWTTVDANFSYRFAESAGALSGTAILLSATNLFDKDAPRTRVRPNLFDLGFDPTNASPVGRLLSLDVTKTW